MVEEYSLKKENFKIVLRKMLPFSIIKLCIPVFLYFAVFSNLAGNSMSIFFIFFTSVLFLYYLIKELVSILKVRKDWISFKIIISDDSITKIQDRTDPVHIAKADITRLIEAAGGTSIQTNDPQAYIFVPNGIEHYENLKSELLRIKPIEVSPLTSINVPPQYALNQHKKPINVLKRLLIGIAAATGGFLLFIILIIVIINFLSN
jgi:hypothetical protein